MEPVMSEKIKKEQEQLFEKYLMSDEKIDDPVEYAMKYGSSALKEYFKKKIKRDEKAWAQGVIIN